MDSRLQPDIGHQARPFRQAGSLHLQRLASALVFLVFCTAQSGATGTIKPTLHSFLHDMPHTVRSNHPVILPVADAIRAVTRNPLEQLVMVNDVTHLLVDFDDDERVYGVPEYYATLDEMIAKRREQGWLYLRDDCDGRAVFAAHLLAALGIPWRLEASYWKRHAWVVARVDGVDYDLLDFRPHTAASPRIAYRLIGHWFVRSSHQPAPFDWRRRWAERTGQDLLIGFQLGLLALDSTPNHLRERHATDWTQLSPSDRHSPSDARVLTTARAGFPYGETLRPSSLTAARTVLPQDQSPLAAPGASSRATGLSINSSSLSQELPPATP